MFVLYGKIRPGWSLVYIRQSNGMVALTPTGKFRKIYKLRFVPFYCRKRDFKAHETTFIWSLRLKGRFRAGFG